MKYPKLQKLTVLVTALLFVNAGDRLHAEGNPAFIGTWVINEELSDDTRDIPVVFVSTKNQRADHIWAEKQGAKALISKPVDSDMIVKQLNTYV